MKFYRNVVKLKEGRVKTDYWACERITESYWKWFHLIDKDKPYNTVPLWYPVLTPLWREWVFGATLFRRKKLEELSRLEIAIRGFDNVPKQYTSGY